MSGALKELDEWADRNNFAISIGLVGGLVSVTVRERSNWAVVKATRYESVDEFEKFAVREIVGRPLMVVIDMGSIRIVKG